MVCFFPPGLKDLFRACHFCVPLKGERKGTHPLQFAKEIVGTLLCLIPNCRYSPDPFLEVILTSSFYKSLKEIIVCYPGFKLYPEYYFPQNKPCDLGVSSGNDALKHQLFVLCFSSCNPVIQISDHVISSDLAFSLKLIEKSVFCLQCFQGLIYLGLLESLTEKFPF